MDTYAGSMMGNQLADLPYLTTQFSMEPMAYSIPDSNVLSSSVKSETLDHFMGGTYDEFDLRGDRSLSLSDTSSQSLSPQPHHRQGVPQLPHLGLSSALFEAGLEQISPTVSVCTSRKDSVDEDHRAERRRAQNRAAQRAYRQRKDQSLRQREKEVESLREELDKAQRLNRTLCKVVAVLRERIKEPADPDEP